jgi:hypothetical protein
MSGSRHHVDVINPPLADGLDPRCRAARFVLPLGLRLCRGDCEPDGEQQDLRLFDGLVVSFRGFLPSRSGLISCIGSSSRHLANRQSYNPICRGACCRKNIAQRFRRVWNLVPAAALQSHATSLIEHCTEGTMNGLIYLVGLIVVIMFILSFLGLR